MNKISNDKIAMSEVAREKRDRAKSLFEKLFALLDIKYDDFNKVFSVKDYKGDKEALLALEKEYPKLGLARFGTEEFGVSTLSIIATITDILIGHRFGVVLDSKADNPNLESMVYGDRRIKSLESVYYSSDEENE